MLGVVVQLRLTLYFYLIERRPHWAHDAESGGIGGSLHATAFGSFWCQLHLFRYQITELRSFTPESYCVRSLRSDVVEVLLLRDGRALSQD